MITDKHKVVLFDHDDTLVATIRAKSDEHKFIAKKYYDIELSDEIIREHWGVPFDKLISILYQTKDIKKAELLNAKHHTEFEKELFPHAIETLQKIHVSGKKIGIITATSKRSFFHDLDHHGFPKEIIDFTQTQEATDHHKPDPKVFEPVKKWLDSIGVEYSDVIYIGDSLRDMQAAVGAGFDFLGVETGFTTAQDFKDAGASSAPSIADVQ